jgi:predicted component of type VI protein secretion system
MAFDLTKEVTLLGRDVTNDIALGDPEVSRQHARLTRTPGGVVVEDLGSTNGTFVNGERLVAPRVLSMGDLLGFGEGVTLAFESRMGEGAATVMGAPGARRGAAAPAPAFVPPPRGGGMPAAPAMQAAEAAPPRRGMGRWVLAAGGCLVLIIVCVGTAFALDALAPQIIYGIPCEVLGVFCP